MCSPKPPKQELTAPPPPLAAPKALAIPDGVGTAPAQSLRIAGKNNLRAKSGLSIPKA